MKQGLSLHMLKFISLIVFLSGISCKEKATKKVLDNELRKPNVLFIAVDDLRPELGAYGNNLILSPNINTLAANGVVFNNHYVQVPTCGASRYALMTGYRPRTRAHLKNDIFYNEMSKQMEKDRPESFVHQLRRNGYYTVGLGKMSHSADGLVYGYEEEVSTVKEMPYSWDEYHFNTGKWETGWNAFFAYANGENRQSLQRQVKPYEAGNVDDNGYPDGLTAELAVAKLQALKNQDKPFFLGVGFFKPHLPFNAPKKYWDMYDRDKISTASNPFIPKGTTMASLHDSGELNGYLLTDEKASLAKPLSEAYSQKLIHGYYASVSYIDAQIGKILDELKTLNLDKNTIVVIWGDHGWHLGNNRVWGKHTLMETALRSAMIIKVPGAIHKMTNTITETVDIYPTILDLCGVELEHKVDGESFKGLFENEDSLENNIAYSYFKNGISLRNKKYRLTKYYRNQESVIELYDYSNGFYEAENIALENPEIVKKLLPILDKGDTGLYRSKD